MAFFAQDKLKFENDVNKVWHEPMTQQMFDALFSIAYNHGNVSKTVLKQLCAGDNWRNEQKMRATWQNLYTCDGLLNRRRREEVNFFYGTQDPGGSYSAPSGGVGGSYIGGSYGNAYSNTGNFGQRTGAGGYEAGGQNNGYQTYSLTVDPAVLSSAMKNTFTPALYQTTDSSTQKHTRIYSATNATLKVDELSLPLNEGEIKDTSSNNFSTNQNNNA